RGRPRSLLPLSAAVRAAAPAATAAIHRDQGKAVRLAVPAPGPGAPDPRPPRHGDPPTPGPLVRSGPPGQLPPRAVHRPRPPPALGVDQLVVEEPEPDVDLLRSTHPCPWCVITISGIALTATSMMTRR